MLRYKDRIFIVNQGGVLDGALETGVPRQRLK